jgi:tetratricopeptide (TPR) repeat protein
MGLPIKGDLPAYTSLARVHDPVVSRLAELKGAFEATEASPSRSARAGRERLLDRVKQGLPAFASAVFDAQADFVEAFSEVDTCPIERALPGLMVRAACRQPDAPPPPRRPAWPAETRLFQEWRLASHYKAVDNAEFTLGSRTRADEALAQWPGDVAAHPYLQRLRATVLSSRGLQGSFDAQLKSARDLARLVVQTSVDLQRADRWLAGHSLTGHMWTGNLNLMNDAEVRDITSKEERLLSVLRFDRFTKDRYMADRRAGDPPFFLAPSHLARMMAGPMPGLTVMAEPAASTAATPRTSVASGTPYRPPLFSPHIAQMELAPEEQLSDALASNPRDLRTRVGLALVKVRNGGVLADAIRLIDAAPDDTRPDHRVGMSNAWAYPAHIFYFAGELDAAQRYYRKVAEIGTGSESDMMARTRLKLLDGRLREALISSAARADRYNSDFARRDQAALLFMLGQREQGWSVFLPNAASSDLFQLWVAAYTGHRMEGTDLAAANRWIDSHQLGSTQIQFKDVRSLYLHLLATMDRLPTPQDIALLKNPRGGWTDPRWPASAQLLRSALTGEGFHDAYQTAKSALAGSSGNPSSSMLMPLYAWVAWQATDGKDEVLDEVRRATTRWGFDEMLAKALVLALDADTTESLKFFNAARYELAATSERLYPGPYSFALAGYLMYRKTGVDAYRQQVLHFVRAQQRVFPFYGWLYAMQALLDRDDSRRAAAACRARHLDPGSYFVDLAGVKGVTPASCKAALGAWLR